MLNEQEKPPTFESVAAKAIASEAAKARYWAEHFPGQERPSTTMPQPEPVSYFDA